MAQYQIPGGPFVNEPEPEDYVQTQYQIPGGPYLNEAVPPTISPWYPLETTTYV